MKNVTFLRLVVLPNEDFDDQHLAILSVHLQKYGNEGEGKSVVGRIRDALAKWGRSEEGKSTPLLHSYFNVGDLCDLLEEIEDLPVLTKCLMDQGILRLQGSVLECSRNTCPQWKFSDPLLECSASASEVPQ